MRKIKAPNAMTENELEDEAAKLRSRMERGQATVGDAERLADVERSLRRIRTVMLRRSW